MSTPCVSEERTRTDTRIPTVLRYVCALFSVTVRVCMCVYVYVTAHKHTDVNRKQS